MIGYTSSKWKQLANQVCPLFLYIFHLAGIQNMKTNLETVANIEI